MPLAESQNTQLSYAQAGVDIEAGDRAVELMKSAVTSSYNDSVVAGQGGFAGLIDASTLKDYKRPLLATSTDGVGTKVAIAQAMDIHHTIGQDLVAMVVDDIAVVGAKPLLMTDYIACGHVDPVRIADIVRGIAEACSAVDTPLLGGETAEHPGLMAANEYDIAGAATGVVEADAQLGSHRVQSGDAIIALASSGLHSNGYSLVRAIIDHAGWDLHRYVDEFGRTLGEELLEPTRLYSPICQKMMANNHNIFEEQGLHALSHITGGGLGANISRVIPAGLCAIIDRASWRIPEVFHVMQRLGNVEWDDMEQTLNLGVGMVAIAHLEAADTLIQIAAQAGCAAWNMGHIAKEDECSHFNGRYISGAKGVDAGSCLLVNRYQ
ncbi:MAG: phosphoribosylformylglycinamidine cyclo-ligase [Actinomycetaceae bacterium]|nr:phosphoribosylformylglycinamidine cyclo-ligase [Actinomycetaceae bacterium]